MILEGSIDEKTSEQNAREKANEGK